MEIKNYDAIIIGAGQGGMPLSGALAQAGWKTALIERKHLGGTCINEGCTPTKTMVASARVAYLARRAADYGVHTGPVTVNLGEVRERKRKIVADFLEGREKRVQSYKGVELLRGQARFTGPKTLEVELDQGGERRALEGKTIFIDVGARPSTPDVAGLDAMDALNSTTLMELDTLPEHLVIIGGGYVGLEFGQMFRRFGSAVTIIQHGPRLLTREDADVADEVAKMLREDGIEILLNTNAVRGEQSTPRKLALTVNGPEGERTLRGSHLLIATGRVPNTDDLGLEAVGITVDRRGQVPVDEQLETNVRGVYALGDVKGGPAFTHISYDDYRIIKTNLLDGGHASIHDRMVPYTLFTDPQLGRIGLGEDAARAQGRKIRVAKIPMNWVARALEVNETRGFMKAIVDPETSQILGAAVLGIEGGELMAMLQIAMMGKLPYPVLQEATFAHPTLSEALNTLFTSFVE